MEAEAQNASMTGCSVVPEWGTGSPSQGAVTRPGGPPPSSLASDQAASLWVTQLFPFVKNHWAVCILSHSTRCLLEGGPAAAVGVDSDPSLWCHAMPNGDSKSLPLYFDRTSSCRGDGELQEN